jgi:hypothetical protein
VCVEVTYNDGGYEVFGVVVEEILEAMSHRGNGMIRVDQSGDDLVIFFDINNDRVGVCEGVVESVIDDVRALEAFLSVGDGFAGVAISVFW